MLTSKKSFIVVLLLVLSSGCSGVVEVHHTPARSPDDGMENRISVTPFPTPRSEKNLAEQHLKEWNQAIGDVSQRIMATEKTLKKDSRIFGIENLKTQRDQADFEIRIWSDQETSLHCLLISKKHGVWTGSMIEGMYILNHRTNNLNLTKIKSSGPLTPKSGWQELREAFLNKGILLPLSYKIDEVNQVPEPDEGLVKVELRSGMEYGLVFYQKLSKSADAVRIAELAKWLQDEFNVDLGY